MVPSLSGGLADHSPEAPPQRADTGQQVIGAILDRPGRRDMICRCSPYRIHIGQSFAPSESPADMQAHARKIPVVLTMTAVRRLLDATRSLKHQAALSVAYGAGLRVAEVAALKVRDVDSKRIPTPHQSGYQPFISPRARRRPEHGYKALSCSPT